MENTTENITPATPEVSTPEPVTPTPKVLDVVDMKTAAEKVSDIKAVGFPGRWQLVCKASSESQGWMKSTKAFQLPRGTLIQVTTQQRNPDGTYSLAEAVTFVPELQSQAIVPPELRFPPVPPPPTA